MVTVVFLESYNMTMHLMGHGYSTVSTKKRKKKEVNVNAKFTQDFNTYNKQMKRLGLKTKTLDEYIAYRQGKSKAEIKTVKEPFKTEKYVRPSPVVSSSGDQIGHIPAKPTMTYSGERKLIGIGTMHKSNSVPIFEQSDAEDIAKMRRN